MEKQKRRRKPKHERLMHKHRANPNAPRTLESEEFRYIILPRSIADFPWKKLAITFAVVLIGGIGSAATQARIANTENDIATLERELRTYQAEIISLNAQIQESYTFVEIERLATERLGMAFPNASQIIEIDVPRVGGVTLNTADYVLPRHNYFLHDIRDFFTGLINQIFGG
jgi:cell division protein FtsL